MLVLVSYVGPVQANLLDRTRTDHLKVKLHRNYSSLLLVLKENSLNIDVQIRNQNLDKVVQWTLVIVNA